MVPRVAGSSPVVRPPLPGSIVTTLQAFLLGLIQGITEFFPVSSSGHLKLAQHLFGFEHLDKYVLFDLAVHLGTLCSIFWIFFPDICSLFKENKKRIGHLALAILPLFPLLLIMKPIKAIMDQPQYLGFFFIVTALLLWAGVQLGEKRTPREGKWGDALIIGGFQALAILPGISRSGSTISGARILGWTATDAITFSFLLAIPTILGGAFVELIQLAKHGTQNVATIAVSHYVIGFITAFITGSLCLGVLKALARKQAFMYFAWYCLILGILTLILLR